MAPSPEDLAFARFRRTGAPEALAEVFDRTAGQLLLVAWHVTHRGAEAEDLVQATFLEAMQSVERFDGERRVLPWLLGILANLASGARRRADHAARLAPGPDVDPRTPLHALLTEEAREEVARALAALPEDYRTVLDLRFVHGLRSIQIARSLGRSPETVRTQVRRGLAHLRRLLPKGLAVPVALLAARGRGLAAVRTAVLAQARVAIVTPVAAFSGAWLLVVLAAVWAAASSWWVGTAEPAPVVAVAAASQVQATSPPVLTASRAAVPEPRVVQAPAAGAAPASAPANGRIRGRCVADESGEPIAAVVVRLGWPALLVASAESGPDGRFALEFPANAASPASLTLDAPGRARLACNFKVWTPGRDLDIGDVRMPHGVQVRGRILDDGGRPVAGTLVSLRNTSLHLHGLPVGNQPGPFGVFRRGQSDDAGRFVCDGPLEPGNWALEVVNRTLIEPKVVPIEGRQREHAIEVVVAAQDMARAIRGRCVDERGQALESVRVSLQDPAHGRTLAWRWSDADGGFVLPWEAAFPELPTVVFAHDKAQPSQGTRESVAWGTKDLLLTLTRKPAIVEATAEVAIEVVDPAGAPIEDFALRCCPDPRQNARFSAELGALRMAGRHPGGRVVVTASTRWRNVLFVEPGDSKLVPAGPVFFSGDQGRVPVVVRLLGEVRVRVTTAAGVPVQGATVELLRPWAPEPVTALTGKVPLRDPFGVLQLETWAVRVSEEVTAADGTATLWAPAGEAGLVLRSLGPVNRPFVRSDVAEGGERIELVAQMGGSLGGRVLGWDAVCNRMKRPSLVLCRRGALFIYIARFVPVWVPQADGAYRIAGVEPGAWDVHLFTAGDSSNEFFAGAFQGTRRFEPPLASVVLEEGKPQTLDLDARPFAPGRVEGRILLDGKPLSYTRWLVESQDLSPFRPDQPGGTTGSDGHFTLDPALPGQHWIVILWTPPSGTQRRLVAREPIKVAAGERVQATVELDSTRTEDPSPPALRR